MHAVEQATHLVHGEMLHAAAKVARLLQVVVIEFAHNEKAVRSLPYLLPEIPREAGHASCRILLVLLGTSSVV
jgi:hypothetical protein